MLRWQSLLLSLALTTASTQAAETMRAACAAEIQKYKCEALSESYAYECLNKHQEARTKDKGFSRSCFKSYASFEKTSGRGEKVESHQVDSPEHKR